MNGITGIDTDRLPDITVLICAYNEENFIAQKLQNTRALQYSPERLHIVVAADGSDDRTADIVKSYREQGVVLNYEHARTGKVAAINRAMSHIHTPIVVFSDANNFFSEDALLHLVSPFADPRVGATSGAKRIKSGDGVLGESEGLYWKYESLIKQSESRLGCCTSVAGEIWAIRRELFESYPPGVINDDFYLAMRIIRRGYEMRYTPEAKSFERVSASAHNEMQRRTRIVAGRYQAIFMFFHLLSWTRPVIVWQVISHKFLRPMVPILMIAALLTNILALVFESELSGSDYLRPFILSDPLVWILLTLQAVFYGCALAGNFVTRDTAIGKLFYLPSFLVNSNLAALQGLIRYLFGHQTSIWQRVQRRGNVHT